MSSHWKGVKSPEDKLLRAGDIRQMILLSATEVATKSAAEARLVANALDRANFADLLDPVAPEPRGLRPKLDAIIDYRVGQVLAARDRNKWWRRAWRALARTRSLGLEGIELPSFRLWS